MKPFNNEQVLDQTQIKSIWKALIFINIEKVCVSEMSDMQAWNLVMKFL